MSGTATAEVSRKRRDLIRYSLSPSPLFDTCRFDGQRQPLATIASCCVLHTEWALLRGLPFSGGSDRCRLP